MRFDGFVFSLIAVVVISSVFSQPADGYSGEILDHISTAGIFLIFFLYGLRLDYAKIKQGLKNWKLHLLVQITTFVIFPFIVLLLYPFVPAEKVNTFWLGLFFLAVLPSTVSSSVVMVSIGRGNIPAAIFNASFSGLTGIVVTPLWMGLFLQHTVSGFDFSEIYIRLVTVILLPVISGFILRRWGSGYISRYGNKLGYIDKTVILLIVYKSFASSFNDNVFSSVSISELSVVGLTVIFLFVSVYLILLVFTRTLRFNREDKITAIFCGSQKSLVHGTVFSKVLFSGFYSTGLLLVPLMMFHLLQIFVISTIAGYYRRNHKE